MSEPRIEISIYNCPPAKEDLGLLTNSRMGKLLMAFRAGKLVSLDFTDYSVRFDTLLKKRWPKANRQRVDLSADMEARLDKYFDGDFSAFEGLAFETFGTEFQDLVWQQLVSIPAGETWTYGQLATSVGKQTASRAIGRTNGLNPIAIVLPCHRVVGGNGKLTGYAGGLPRKEWLLHHERAIGEKAIRQ
ncbi:MAG: methylated-DNA--[protein]-cysteine S-methyltransferase [Alphaproteobacteria bacterium]